MAEDDFETDRINNKIEAGLKSDLDTAVGVSDHDQRTILSAVIENGLKVLDVEEERIVVPDEDKIGDELDKYSDMYG